MSGTVNVVECADCAKRKRKLPTTVTVNRSAYSVAGLDVMFDTVAEARAVAGGRLVMWSSVQVEVPARYQVRDDTSGTVWGTFDTISEAAASIKDHPGSHAWPVE